MSRRKKSIEEIAIASMPDIVKAKAKNCGECHYAYPAIENLMNCSLIGGQHEKTDTCKDVK